MQKLSTKKILQNNQARTAPQSMQQVVILLHNIRSMHNVGAAFRSADAFGIKKVLLSGITPTPPRSEITKTAIGAEEFMEWEKIEFKDKLKALKKNDYTTVGLEQTTNSTLFPDYHLPSDKKLCLIFGNEVTGIDDEILPYINQFVEFPQYGNKHSLNVSVAVGVALYGFLEKFW